jgi:hypothetical protein
VIVPDKCPLKLDELDLLPVKLCHNFGAPVFGNESEFFSESYYVHSWFEPHQCDCFSACELALRKAVINGCGFFEVDESCGTNNVPM